MVFEKLKTKWVQRAAAAAAAASTLAVLSILPAQATPIGVCPGGAQSGTEASSSGQTCSNLHNDDLQPQRTFPRDLYRGDSRVPYDIFRNGFTSMGSNDDIQAHVHGVWDSNYISTTGTLSVAEQFARSQGMRNLDALAARPLCSTAREAFYAIIPVFGPLLLAGCQHGLITADSFVYVIDPVAADNALYVPDQLRGNPEMRSQYQSQDEWAYVHHITNNAIQGVRVYRMTATVERGYLNMRTITFNYDRFLPNAYYIPGVRPDYNPANATHGNFNFLTNLNVPEAPANPYQRGCSHIDRCR